MLPHIKIIGRAFGPAEFGEFLPEELKHGLDPISAWRDLSEVSRSAACSKGAETAEMELSVACL